MVASLRASFCALLPAVVAFSTCDVAFAAKKGTADKPANARVIELFDGIKSGDLSVHVIPKNEFLSRVRITNNTRQPLSVQLPKAVAAVQIFKQVQPGGFFPGNGNQNNGNNRGNGNNAGNNRGAQNVGGQFGNRNGNGNGFGNGNQLQNGFGNGVGNGVGPGFFSIPPEKTVIVPLHTVCLEHGKRTPSMRMTYELRPLRSVADDAALEKLLAGFLPKRTDRKAVQAAAWHLASKMSWKQLQAKNIRHIGGRTEPYFTRSQLRAAYVAVQTVNKDAKTVRSQSVRISRR